MHVDTIFGAVGRFTVRFRWLVLLVWIAGAVAAVTQLPALSSVTQNNNSKFLPASAPSEHAVQLLAPFGTATLVPIPVVAAPPGAPLSPASAGSSTPGGRPTGGPSSSSCWRSKVAATRIRRSTW
jgi:hypothetical protein